jgi:hypothetical protein
MQKFKDIKYWKMLYGQANCTLDKVNASQEMPGLATYYKAESDYFIGCIMTGKKL